MRPTGNFWPSIALPPKTRRWRLGNPRVDELFKGLDFARVDDQAGNAASLIQEIWRLFLAAMMIAMLVEAALCLPKPARLAGAVT